MELLVIGVLVVVGCAERDSSAGAVAAGADRAVVRDVIDGDTIRVERSGQEATVRLLGIDTPESKHPGRPVECGAREATSSLLRLLFSAPDDTDGDGLMDEPGGRARTVTLEVDDSQARVDRYGRLLAYVDLRRGGSVQGAQLARGWARVYVFRGRRFRRVARFRARELEARRAGAGVWGLCGGEFHRPAEP